MPHPPGTPLPLKIPAHVLDLLACPACRHPLLPAADEQLACVSCGRVYPVEDGIPILLIDRAILPAAGDPS